MPLLPAGPSARSARRCWTGSLWSLHAALRFSIRGGFPGPGVLLSTRAVSRQQQETAAGHSSQSRGLSPHPPVATLSHPSWNAASPLASQPQPPASRLSFQMESIKKLPDGTQSTARPRVLKPYPESPTCLFLAIPGLLMVLEQRPRQTGVTAGPLRPLELPSPPSPPLCLHSCFTERAHVPPTPGSPHLRPLLPALLTPTPDRSQQKALFSAHPSLKEEATAFAEKASSLLTQGPFRHLGFFFFFGLKHPRLGGVDSPSSFVFLEQESGSVGTLCTSCLGLQNTGVGSYSLLRVFSQSKD